ncbi:NERD domain-containing protein [Ruminococcaceae bacterium OttesenSCG-928-D13]|nr:NERD domain-containing protein [Ruminococcaceae bacterium OttesenSCG-928-D13]
MDQVMMIVAAVVSVVALVALVIWYLRKQNPKAKGAVGRDHGTAKAAAAMRGFARSNSFRYIAPVRFERSGIQANLDAVVVGYFGILGVVALGYNGEVYGNPNDAEWVQVSETGERVKFPNPITEASADVRALRDVLNSAGLKRVPVEVVCVFTNPDASLALPRSTGHYTMKSFKALLKKEKYLEDSGLDLDKVEQAMKEAAQQG